MLIDQFIVLFALLLTGFLCKRFSVFSDSAVNGINTFVIYIGYPCLILVKTASMDMNHSVFLNFLFVLFISIGLFLLFGVYARLYFRGRRFSGDDRSTLELATFLPNNGFIGFPVAITFFGNAGLLFMVASNVAMNFTTFTYGLTILKRGRETTPDSLRKTFLTVLRRLASPNISAAIAGIILCYNGIKLPGAATGFLDTVGNIATPMAMIAIGTMLVGSFGPHTFKKRAVMEPMLNKLFVMPLVTAVIVWFLPLVPLAKTIMIVANALPTAAVTAVLCEQYKRDKALASETVVISTLISMVTIPLAIWVLGNLRITRF